MNPQRERRAEPRLGLISRLDVGLHECSQVVIRRVLFTVFAAVRVDGLAFIANDLVFAHPTETIIGAVAVVAFAVASSDPVVDLLTNTAPAICNVRVRDVPVLVSGVARAVGAIVVSLSVQSFVSLLKAALLQPSTAMSGQYGAKYVLASWCSLPSLGIPNP